jgi:2-isopropylmalate synthase
MGDPAVIRIFDTTLRDGEQSPGATMTTPEKIHVAEQLVRLHVDSIEAGFPAASPGDLEAVKEIARHVQDVAIAGLARAAVSDIDAAWEAVCDAEQPVIHVFLATSAIHLTHTLKLGFEEALQQVKDMVAYARNLCPTVEFSAEDATRSDWEYLCRVFEAAIKSGATTVNVPDTVGYTTPYEYEALFRYLRQRVPGIEDVVMALRTRPDCFGNLATRINAREFLATSQLVSKITGIPVQPNKSVVGANAFAHEAGIHQDGMLKNRMTYEIMTPQSVGWAETQLVLGKHSVRHGLDARLRQLGCKLNAEQLKVAYSRFVSMADHKKHITDADLLYIAETSMETFSAI